MTATASTTSTPKPAPVPRNGVDLPKMFATIGAVSEHRELAQFQFRATTRWIKGTHARTTIDGFSGAGGEHTHKQSHGYDADHPEVLVGEDNAPSPIEFVLHALGCCLTAGIATVAAARRVDLEEVVAKIEGDIDLQGVLGLSDQVRNGYKSIRVQFELKGNAPDEKLREIVEQSRKRSAVFDVLTRPVPVEIVVNAN